MKQTLAHKALVLISQKFLETRQGGTIKHSSTLSLLVMGLILVLGFQNCGDAKFIDQDDLIQGKPLSSIYNNGRVSIDNTKFTGGLSFSYILKTDTETSSIFQVKKISGNSYSAQEGGRFSTCVLENPNAMEELMQITEVATVTHPSFLAQPEICDPLNGYFFHFKIGEKSPIYLIAKSSADNCLLDDPQRLLDEGKRVFVINNLSFEEIETLITESQAIANSNSCFADDTTSD